MQNRDTERNIAPKSGMDPGGRCTGGADSGVGQMDPGVGLIQVWGLLQGGMNPGMELTQG